MDNPTSTSVHQVLHGLLGVIQSPAVLAMVSVLAGLFLLRKISSNAKYHLNNARGSDHANKE
jgi:hypothetical protein